MEKQKSRIVLFLLALTMVITGIIIPGMPLEVEAASDIGLTVTMPSGKAVRDYWRNYQTKGNPTIDKWGIKLADDSSDKVLYDRMYNVNNKEKGIIKQPVIDDTLHIINTMRYSVGMSPVTESKELTNYAQAGSFLMYANRLMSHEQPTPPGMSDTDQVVLDGQKGALSSNISISYNIYEQPGVYVRDDIGAFNKAIVGHRRWLFLPSQTEMGVGQVGRYGATYVTNAKTTEEVNNMVFPYPGKGGISEWMSPTTPLSVHFGIYYDITNARVKITNLDTGKIYNYSSENGLTINTSTEYAQSQTLTFGEGLDYQPGASYRVIVTGVTKGGAAYPIEYDINYTSILGDASQTIIKEETRREIDTFLTIQAGDSNLEKGQIRVQQEGQDGIREITEKVTYINGTESKREFVSEKVIQEVQHRIVFVGTKEPKPEPVITTEQITKQETIPFKTVERTDATILEGEIKVSQEGISGIKEIIEEITYTDGKETSRKVISEKVVKQPIEKIVLIGIKPKEVLTQSDFKTTNTIPFKIIEEQDPELEEGKVVVVQEGKNGIQEIVTRVYYRNGEEYKREKISDTITVQPINKVIKIGTKKVAEEDVITTDTTVRNEIIPFNTKEVADSKLPQGERVLDTKGVNGTRTITEKYTYKNGILISKEIISDVVSKEAIDEVIRYGTMKPDVITTEEDTTEELIPFKTIEKKDPTLPLGTTKVSQKGVEGIKTIITEITYKNGQEDSRKIISEKITKAPIDEIILIGTKEDPIEDDVITYDEIKKEEVISFTTEKKEDSTLEKGKVVVSQKGVDGIKEIIEKVTYTNDKETNREIISEKIIKEPVKEILLIGTKIVPIDEGGGTPGQDVPVEPIEEDPVDEPELEGLLKFDFGGGQIDGKTSTIIKANIGDEIIIPEGPVKEGFKFTFWKGSKYYPGDKYVVTGDHNFEAQFIADTPTIDEEPIEEDPVDKPIIDEPIDKPIVDEPIKEEDNLLEDPKDDSEDIVENDDKSEGEDKTPIKKPESKDNNIKPGWINDNDQKEDPVKKNTDKKDSKVSKNKKPVVKVKSTDVKKENSKAIDKKKNIKLNNNLNKKKPNNKNPKMGDFNVIPYVLLTFVSASGLVLTKSVEKKKKK